MGERQQDQLGDRHSFDQQKRAICTEDAQRALHFIAPDRIYTINIQPA